MAPRKKAARKCKNNPKAAKLEALLEDFDSEVKTRVQQMTENKNALLKSVESNYNMAPIKLPKAVRQANWMDFLGSEKPKSDVDTVAGDEDTVESVLAKDHVVKTKSVKKKSKKQAGANTSSEDENIANRSTVTKMKPHRKPPSSSKRAMALSVIKQNPTRSSNRKPMSTPARNMLDSSLLMAPTPLITPRFDPRLPKTPAARVVRHQERLYSISVNGSPVAVPGEDVVISVPTGNGESIQLLSSEMDSLELLDEYTLKHIRLLQNRLTTLCGPPV